MSTSRVWIWTVIIFLALEGHMFEHGTNEPEKLCAWNIFWDLINAFNNNNINVKRLKGGGGSGLKIKETISRDNSWPTVLLGFETPDRLKLETCMLAKISN